MATKQVMSRGLSSLSRALASPSAAARFLPRPSPGRSLHQNRLVLPAEGIALPTGDRLLERLRSLTPERLRFDSLVSVEDARKVLRASRVAAVREKLRELPERSIPYREFLRICCGSGGEEEEDGVWIAETLDRSGDVIVLGHIVFLRPNQVAQAIQGVIHNSMNKGGGGGEEEELRKMEKAKAEMDAKAEAGVKKELWTGLGLLAVQTLGFMRLTFWELSWDVMEPVCFYVTSLYFMLGYAFFLRTSRDPSFEGFFQTRFQARQRRLFEDSGFDLRRFHDLRRLIYGRDHHGGNPNRHHQSMISSATLQHCKCGHDRDASLLLVGSTN